LSEQLDPTELVRFLNECLGTMSNAILEHGGSIDKDIGDAIVAMFGAPLDQPDHAARACRAALAAQRALDAQRPAWRARGLPEIRVRIGLNTGDALVGNLGSERRFDDTMLGDTVNLAARLEGVNGEYGTDVLAGERTAEAVVGTVGLREVDTVRLKGKRQAVRVFEVVSAEPEVQPSPTHAAYAQALARYRAGDFEAAAADFEALRPDGDAPAEVMAARARARRRPAARLGRRVHHDSEVAAPRARLRAEVTDRREPRRAPIAAEMDARAGRGRLDRLRPGGPRGPVGRRRGVAGQRTAGGQRAAAQARTGRESTVRARRAGGLARS
jgi:class 3 adenylate cyclase